MSNDLQHESKQQSKQLCRAGRESGNVKWNDGCCFFQNRVTKAQTNQGAGGYTGS
jgi:hypothetical protein